jgi:hypothetical protein
VITEQRKGAETQRTQREAVPWFNCVERVELLRAKAATWIGTRFFPNGRVKGSGVSCQMFAPMLLGEVGFLPASVVDAIPEGPMNWSRANKNSLIAEYIDANLQQYFVGIVGRPVNGDLIGIEIDACVQHLGVCLGERFVHIFQPRTPRVTEQDGVREDRVDLYFHRMKRIWRPIEYGC